MKKFWVAVIGLVLAGIHSTPAGEGIPRHVIRPVATIHDIQAWQEQNQSWWERLWSLFQTRRSQLIIQPLGIDAQDGWLAVADPFRGGVHLLSFARQKYRFIPFGEQMGASPPVDVALGPQDTLYVVGGSPPSLWYCPPGKEQFMLRALDFTPERITGLACDGRRLYMVDTPAHVVYKVGLDGRLLQKAAHRGKSRRGLNYPTFIAVGGGLVYITDTMNFRVVAATVDSLGSWQLVLGTPGVMSGQLNRPKGVAVDGSGAVYVVDASFDNVQIFSPQGRLLDILGHTGHGPEEFSGPTDIALDGQWLYISDTLNHCIKIFQVQYE